MKDSKQSSLRFKVNYSYAEGESNVTDDGPEHKFEQAAHTQRGFVKQRQQTMDPENARFPHCIVWTPLPLISWILPFIGHTGIAMSDGVIHDFAGPYTITIDDLAFGETHK